MMADQPWDSGQQPLRANGHPPVGQPGLGLEPSARRSGSSGLWESAKPRDHDTFDETSSSNSSSNISEHDGLAIRAVKSSILGMSSRRPSYAAEFSTRKLPALSPSGGSSEGFGSYGHSFGLWERTSPTPQQTAPIPMTFNPTPAPFPTSSSASSSSSSTVRPLAPPSLQQHHPQLRQFRSQSFSVGQTEANTFGTAPHRPSPRLQRPSLLSEHSSFTSSMGRNLPIFEEHPGSASASASATAQAPAAARSQVISRLLSERAPSSEAPDGQQARGQEDLDRYFSNDDHRVRARDSTLLMRPNYGSGANATAGPLYIVEFKACRSDVFFVPEASSLQIHIGDLVIVEADRGRDLGKVIRENVTPAQVRALKAQQAAEQQAAMVGAGVGPASGSNPSAEAFDGSNAAAVAATAAAHFQPKVVHRLAQPAEIAQLLPKARLENEAVQMCGGKVRARRLPMDVVDAEYQWDRRKLTFYYCANQRIDFRELVKDLFKIYKTRIWMCAVNPSGNVANPNTVLGAPGAVGDRAAPPPLGDPDAEGAALGGYDRYLSPGLPPPAPPPHHGPHDYGMLGLYEPGPWHDPRIYSGPVLG